MTFISWEQAQALKKARDEKYYKAHPYENLVERYEEDLRLTHIQIITVAFAVLTAIGIFAATSMFGFNGGIW